MKTININIFRINELTAEAYDRAYRKHVENYNYWERDGADAAQCFKVIASAFDVEIRDWSMSIYSGVEADWLIDADAEKVEGRRAWVYVQNNFLNNAKGKFFWVGSVKHRYSRLDNPNWLENGPFCGCFYDLAVVKAWKEFTASVRNGDRIKVKHFFELINRYFGKMIEEEYKIVTSEREFLNYCEDADLWFYKNGEVFGEGSAVNPVDVVAGL